jgi:hypothetical protein
LRGQLFPVTAATTADIKPDLLFDGFKGHS